MLNGRDVCCNSGGCGGGGLYTGGGYGCGLLGGSNGGLLGGGENRGIFGLGGMSGDGGEDGDGCNLYPQSAQSVPNLQCAVVRAPSAPSSQTPSLDL